MSKSIDEASTAVKDYLCATNRPYSSNDIFNNLQNKFSKAIVVKVLDNLAADNEICEKVNGKQKIYFASQDNFEINDQKLKEIGTKFDTCNQDVNKLKELIATKEHKIKALEEHVPIGDLQARLTSICTEVEQLKEKLDKINSKCKNIDRDVHSNVKKTHKTLVDEWKNRKRLASQVIDMILENYSKPKRAFLEEVGIETDEDANVTIPS